MKARRLLFALPPGGPGDAALSRGKSGGGGHRMDRIPLDSQGPLAHNVFERPERLGHPNSHVDTGKIPHFGFIEDPATGISPRRRLYEPEASNYFDSLSRKKVQ